MRAISATECSRTRSVSEVVAQPLDVVEDLGLRGASSDASGSSMSRMRGWARSARPIATRCFSPPESVRGGDPAARAVPSSSHDALSSMKCSPALRSRCPYSEVAPARRGAGTAASPGTRSRRGDARAERRCPRGVEQHRAVHADRGRGRLADAGDRVDHAGLARTRRPNRPTIGASAANFTSSAKSPSRCVDINVDHRGCARAARRVSHSDPASATIDSTTATILSRSACASPPGTCVNV